MQIMNRLSMHRALVLVVLFGAAACYDRPNAAPAADRQAAGGEHPTGERARRGDSALPSTAAADADPAPPAGGDVPKRSHRDSVALASMTRPDSVLDRRWPVKMPAPLPGAIFPAELRTLSPLGHANR